MRVNYVFAYFTKFGIFSYSTGHLTFERSTAVQREEDRRVRQLDRSSSSTTAGANSLPQSLIRTKTPKPVRHTVWKSRGEEYRRLGGDGWMWLSTTRRSPAEESKAVTLLYPTINELARRSETNRPRCRGLQHGIGWGACPEYLKVNGASVFKLIFPKGYEPIKVHSSGANLPVT
ncbi:unnamed protein product [Echinostoma caproni]|uniref:Secreted protein n=1 Tax=Echinostoma caproni TaxID=27848 RepID=A0A183A3R5_9TREM|nr:unnamed protein product [Echinostoma caproni]